MAEFNLISRRAPLDVRAQDAERANEFNEIQEAVNARGLGLAPTEPEPTLSLVPSLADTYTSFGRRVASEVVIKTAPPKLEVVRSRAVPLEAVDVTEFLVDITPAEAAAHAYLENERRASALNAYRAAFPEAKGIPVKREHFEKKIAGLAPEVQTTFATALNETEGFASIRQGFHALLNTAKNDNPSPVTQSLTKTMLGQTAALGLAHRHLQALLPTGSAGHELHARTIEIAHDAALDAAAKFRPDGSDHALMPLTHALADVQDALDAQAAFAEYHPLSADAQAVRTKYSEALQAMRARLSQVFIDPKSSFEAFRVDLGKRPGSQLLKIANAEMHVAATKAAALLAPTDARAVTQAQVVVTEEMTAYNRGGPAPSRTTLQALADRIHAAQMVAGTAISTLTVLAAYQRAIDKMIAVSA